MKRPTDKWPLARLSLWNTLFWVVLWSFSVFNNYQWARSAGSPFNWNMVFSWSFPYYMVMVLSGPLIIWLYGRWRVKTYLKQGLGHLLPSISSGFVHQLALNVFYVLYHPVSIADTTRDFQAKFQLRYEVGSVFSANGFLFYWLCIGLLLGVDLFRRYRNQELTNLSLEAELNRAKFSTLQSQIQPHFLFNAFNSLSMLARQEKHEQVVKTIASISNLLRESLKLGDKREIPLSEELKLVSHYLEVERIRFRDRLTISTEVVAEAKAVMVPALLLQPVVENAIIHGVAKTEGQARLSICITREDGKLIINIAGSAPLLADSWDLDSQMGIGLSNVLKRLELSYGQDFSLALQNQSDHSGTQTLITLPLG